jgi:hypothetical protein
VGVLYDRRPDGIHRLGVFLERGGVMTHYNLWVCDWCSSACYILMDTAPICCSKPERHVIKVCVWKELKKPDFIKLVKHLSSSLEKSG